MTSKSMPEPFDAPQARCQTAPETPAGPATAAACSTPESLMDVGFNRLARLVTYSE